jgi:hypothetical protein
MAETDPRPLEAFSDSALLHELRERKLLRDVHIERVIRSVERASANFDEVSYYIHHDMIHMLAMDLAKNRVVQMEESAHEHTACSVLRMRLTVVMER